MIPSNVEPLPAPSPLGWRGLVWLLYFLAWTAALLLPMPGGTPPGLEWVTPWKFSLAKSLHLAAYAVLAVLSGWLHVPLRFRWILLFIIMAHAPVTELIQLRVEGRTGSLHDVGLDHLGLGLVLSWKWWSDPA
jgi:hypothetical protein